MMSSKFWISVQFNVNLSLSKKLHTGNDALTWYCFSKSVGVQSWSPEFNKVNELYTTISFLSRFPNNVWTAYVHKLPMLLLNLWLNGKFCTCTSTCAGSIEEITCICQSCHVFPGFFAYPTMPDPSFWLFAEHTFASLPVTVRGFPIVINGDPKGKNFLYCNGNYVFIREIEVCFTEIIVICIFIAYKVYKRYIILIIWSLSLKIFHQVEFCGGFLFIELYSRGM